MVRLAIIQHFDLNRLRKNAIPKAISKIMRSAENGATNCRGKKWNPSTVDKNELNLGILLEPEMRKIRPMK
jgi:hypothetical protein